MSAGRDVVCLRREGYRLFVLACEAIVGLLVVVYRSRADRRSAVRTGAQTEARGRPGLSAVGVFSLMMGHDDEGVRVGEADASR